MRAHTSNVVGLPRRVTIGQFAATTATICTSIAVQAYASATMNADWLPDDAPVRSLCGRMVCTRCGHIGADVRPDQAACLSGLTSAYGSIRRQGSPTTSVLMRALDPLQCTNWAVAKCLAYPA